MFKSTEIILRKNKTYDEDVEFAFKILKFLFKPIGIWTLVTFDNTLLDLWLSKLSYVVCFFVLPFLLLPALIHIIFVEKDGEVIVLVLGGLVFIFGSFLKYICIILHKNNISHCFKCIANDWKDVEKNSRFREIMINNVKIAHRITISSTIFMILSGLSYRVILPLTKSKIYFKTENITKRRLVYPGTELFFDSQISPNYEIVFFLHCFYAVISYAMTSAALGTAALFVLHVSGQIQILVLKVNDFVNIHGGKANISEIVDQHVKIMRFAKCSSRILREICFIEFFVSTLVACFAEHYCIMEWGNRNFVGVIIYIGVWIFLNINMFILCFVGELIIYESTKIGLAVFNTSWYDLPSDKVLELKMIMIRSMRSPKLTAGNIADVSISTFAFILKAALTYLNLHRSLTT